MPVLHHSVFTGRIPFLLPNQQCQSTEGKQQLECGPMPKVMAALPNIGGALCSTPRRLADAQYCNTAKTLNPLKLAGVPQTTGPISAASGPKFTTLCGYVEILLLNPFAVTYS